MPPALQEKMKPLSSLQEIFKEPRPGFPLGSSLNCVTLLRSFLGITLVPLISARVCRQLPAQLALLCQRRPVPLWDLVAVRHL